MVKKGHARSESLRAQVYGKLRSDLRRGGLGTQQVATERDLAAELGVSRTPIREALALLVHDGLVVPTTKGFTLPSITGEDVADIYELRRLLEPHALRTSVDHLSPADRKALRRALDEQVEARRDGDTEGFIAANSAFRVAWTSRIANERIRDLIDHYDDHIVALRELTLSDPDTQDIVIAGLGQILDRLDEGEAAGAAQAMERHLTAAEAALKRALREKA
ncbi:GntR family transcriptional regulator [Rhizorhabdus wittichii]|uniref:GntR family transcriptional regulator n=1 Tax=Rhizorhabdus wittichii TaxID=160791 RepID=UPI00030A6D82|nr:GntR family transcriptional regulator [Rhizorhabdus wittichii]